MPRARTTQSRSHGRNEGRYLVWRVARADGDAQAGLAPRDGRVANRRDEEAASLKFLGNRDRLSFVADDDGEYGGSATAHRRQPAGRGGERRGIRVQGLDKPRFAL